MNESFAILYIVSLKGLQVVILNWEIILAQWIAMQF